MTEKNKDGAKSGCVFPFFVLCLSYHFKWQTVLNLFIFHCSTFHCVNSKMLNEFNILTRLIK